MITTILNRGYAYLSEFQFKTAPSDADGDGIWDTPYSINSDNDNYPLMEPFENYEVGSAALTAWAYTVPSIDGTLSLGEWEDACKVEFTLSYGDESHACTLYVKNDASNLYLAAIIRTEDYSDGDQCGFFFDNDNDGVMETGDDAIKVVQQYGTVGGLFYDSWILVESTGSWTPYTDQPEGTIDGCGKGVHTNPSGALANGFTSFSIRLTLGTMGMISTFQQVR